MFTLIAYIRVMEDFRLCLIKDLYIVLNLPPPPSPDIITQARHYLRTKSVIHVSEWLHRFLTNHLSTSYSPKTFRENAFIHNKFSALKLGREKATWSKSSVYV